MRKGEKISPQKEFYIAVCKMEGNPHSFVILGMRDKITKKNNVLCSFGKVGEDAKGVCCLRLTLGVAGIIIQEDRMYEIKDRTPISTPINYKAFQITQAQSLELWHMIDSSGLTESKIRYEKALLEKAEEKMQDEKKQHLIDEAKKKAASAASAGSAPLSSSMATAVSALEPVIIPQGTMDAKDEKKQDLIDEAKKKAASAGSASLPYSMTAADPSLEPVILSQDTMDHRDEKKQQIIDQTKLNNAFNSVATLSYSNTCRHTALAFLDCVLDNAAVVDDLPSSFWRDFPHKTIVSAGEIQGDFFILPQPPMPGPQFDILAPIFKQLEKVPKKFLDNKQTCEKFTKLKELYESLAPLKESPITEVFQRIHAWEMTNKSLIDTRRGFWVYKTNTRGMMDQLKQLEKKHSAASERSLVASSRSQ